MCGCTKLYHDHPPT